MLPQRNSYMVSRIHQIDGPPSSRLTSDALVTLARRNLDYPLKGFSLDGGPRSSWYRI